MHSKMGSKTNLPLPEIGDQVSFRQRSLNDSFQPSKRPPKLYQKSHDASYNRSLNQSIPHAISFFQDRHHSSILSSVYKQSRPESYFEQCFNVLDRIGEGSFGEVFKVRSKEDGRLYAIKKSIKLYRGETYRQERIEEVRRYEQFSEHENCITLHNAWEQNDLLYMQLELCQSNLETYAMENKNLTETKIWDILVDLLLALKALHDQNLIHLDIKLENIMIGEDNICKLGDFGLVIDLNRPNIHQAMEGDCRYVAPELLQGCFSKAADIFSLGITILELACNLDLPKNGYLWHKLRSGMLPEEFIRLLSTDLQNIIKWMMNPDPYKRPNVDSILATKKIQDILVKRRMVRPFIKIKLWTQNIWNSFYAIKIYIYNIFTSLMSVLKLNYVKPNRSKDLMAQTSTPIPTTVLQEPSDDSFLQLEDSDIDFEESPSNRSQSKIFLKPVETQIVNSTPLNHYNSQGNYRRNRSELSRTSLVFDDNENGGTGSNSTSWRLNGEDNDIAIVSPIKCKKLFEISDDSD